MRAQCNSLVIVAGSGDYTGAGKMAHLYGREFRNMGWSVSYIVGDPPAGDATRLGTVLEKDNFDFAEELGFIHLRDASLISRMATRIQQMRPAFVLSAVQIDLKIVGPVCRKLRVPYLVFDQTLHNFFGPWPLPAIKKHFFGREMRTAAAIVAVGPAVRAQAIDEFRCRPENVFVVPNGIVTSDYLVERRPVSAAGSPAIRGLNIGRIDPQKGQRVLVEAIAQVIAKGLHVQVDLAGGVTPNHRASEDYQKDLLEDVRKGQLKQAVQFLGWKSDVKALLVDYDFYVHSALWEGPPLPLSVLEAMASGLPVILTDCVGRPDGFVDDIHGRIVKAGDSRSLADAMAWMCQLSPEQRMVIGENCRRLAAERYDVSVTGRQFVNICQQVLRT